MKTKKQRPFKGIQLIVVLILSFVLLVTIGIFCILVFYKGAPKTDIDAIGDMQSVTLAISAISVSFISGIVTILVFYRERKTELLNSQVEMDLSKVEKERDLLSKLLYLQTNNSRYLLGAQYRSLIQLGENIFNSELESKYQLLYIIISLLEKYTTTKNDIDILRNNVYLQIIKFAEKIVAADSVVNYEKTNALFVCIHAHYMIFRDEFERDPDSTDDYHLNEAINYLTMYEKNFIVVDDKESSTELNLAGLVYYWKYKYALKTGSDSIEQLRGLIIRATKNLEQAAYRNHTNEQIHNNYGCSLMGYAKYLELVGNESLSDRQYDVANSEFQFALKLSPTYEKPYINLIDICCLRIKTILKIKSDIYLLRPFIDMESSEIDEKIQEQIEIGRKYYNAALQTGQLLYNIYYIIAELETYDLLLTLRRHENGNSLKKEIINYLNRSEADKKTVKALIKKRQLYELCDDTDNMNEVNSKIQEKDSKNSSMWTSLIEGGTH